MKNKFTGLLNVFKFAYIQSVKTKTFAVTMAILCGIALLALPVITAIGRMGKDEVDKDNIELIGKVYVCDQVFEGKLAEELVDIIAESDEYSGKEYIIIPSKDYDTTYDEVKVSKNGDILLDISFNENMTDLEYGFSYVVYYGENVEKLDEASDDFAFYIDCIHQQALASLLASSEEDAKLLSYTFTSEAIVLNLNGEDLEDDLPGEVVVEEPILDMLEYWITYAFLMISIFSISILGSKVSEQIVTEKSSKVIEYIMTSIRPMALITGKVLASLCILFTMIAGVLASFAGSVLINGMIFREADGSMALPGFLKQIIEQNALEGLSVINIVSSIFVFFLGFLMYGFLAGIAGATVSKVEEMAEGLKLFTFAMIIGAYVVIAYMTSASAGAGWGGFTNFVYLFPLCSPFIVPASLLLGKVSVGIGLLSVAILVVAIVLLMIFVSGVFEYLIYYNGSPLKLKELIKIFRKKGGINDEK